MIKGRTGNANRSEDPWAIISFLSRQLWNRRLELEWRIVSCLFRDPPSVLAALDGIGCGPELFDSDDLHLLFWVMRCFTGRDRVFLVNAAEAMLRQHGYWDKPSRVFGHGWRERDLLELACGEDQPEFALQYARELLDLIRRVEEARYHWRRMKQLLSIWRDEVPQWQPFGRFHAMHRAASILIITHC